MSPTWDNVVEGQINLKDAVRAHHRARQRAGQGLPAQQQTRRADRPPARLAPVREAHHATNGEPVPGAFVDFGLFFFHNASSAGARHRPVLLSAEDGEPSRSAPVGRGLRLLREASSASPQGSIKATVLIETILAAFEMDEILYELQATTSSRLNCGRWDYIFSFIKKFAQRRDFVLPDRAVRSR